MPSRVNSHTILQIKDQKLELLPFYDWNKRWVYGELNRISREGLRVFRPERFYEHGSFYTPPYPPECFFNDFFPMKIITLHV